MAQSKQKLHRRRQFFIKKEFQGKFILLYAFLIISLAILTSYGLFLSLRKTLESQLYSSHLKVERSGDLLQGILLKTNVAAVFAIVVLVVILSLYIFKRLNTHFFHMEQRIDAMSQGDFTMSAQPSSRFNEISRLISLLEQTQHDYRQRFDAIAETLNEIEEALQTGADPEQLQAVRARLGKLLQEVALPE